MSNVCVLYVSSDLRTRKVRVPVSVLLEGIATGYADCHVLRMYETKFSVIYNPLEDKGKNRRHNSVMDLCCSKLGEHGTASYPAVRGAALLVKHSHDDFADTSEADLNALITLARQLNDLLGGTAV